MKILFTGASSFSGMWFVQELVKAGHEVTAVFYRPLNQYTGIRRQRVDVLLDICKSRFGISFGDAAFLDIIALESPWDLFCHHAADVTNYKSPDFDAVGALGKNTHHIKLVMQALKESGCDCILLTGSVFEQNEGAGSNCLRAVSPYGLSKGLTSDFFAYYTSIYKMTLGKFVIPNPFGPYEEGRFTTYLVNSWLNGKTPVINTPRYIRDNVPITLLANAYVDFSEGLAAASGYKKINPSCYLESQAMFTQRFSNEMNKRLGVPCWFDLAQQDNFNEPLIRVNTDSLDWTKLRWDETKFWDELAIYYQNAYSVCQPA